MGGLRRGCTASSPWLASIALWSNLPDSSFGLFFLNFLNPPLVINLSLRRVSCISPGGYFLIWPTRGCAAGQGMFFCFSVQNRLYNFVQVCSKGISCNIDLISKSNGGGCPKRGMYFRVFFSPRQGQGFKSSPAHLYPNTGLVPLRVFL